MEWKSKLINELPWAGEISNLEQKQKIAKRLAEKLQTNQVIGVGSGSTVYIGLLEIAETIKSKNLKIKAIPTSIEIGLTCARLGIPTTTLNESRPDWCFDGADEVNGDKWLIKGRGGALFQEKLLIRSSLQVYILVDQSKIVKNLGSNFPVPIELIPRALPYVEKALKELGAYEIVLRLAKGKDGPIITENGNLLLDCRFTKIDSALELQIKSITGVIESGLFINYPIEIWTI